MGNLPAVSTLVENISNQIAAADIGMDSGKPAFGQLGIVIVLPAHDRKIGPPFIERQRMIAGHPEGFLEAFASHYRNFADTILLKEESKAVDPIINDFPQVHDGVRGMAFIETVVASSKAGSAWTKMPKV